MLWLHICIIGHEIKHKKNTYDRSKLLIVLLMPIKISNMVPSKFNCVCRDSILKPNDVNIKLCDSSFNSLTSIVNDSKSSFILRRRQDFAKSPPYFCLQCIQTKVRWRICKIVWPSQNIWTLKPLSLNFFSSWLPQIGKWTFLS